MTIKMGLSQEQRETMADAVAAVLADTEAALWARRDAITAVIQYPPAPATLIDHHGRQWTSMTLWKYTEADRTDRGRKRSLQFTAIFRQNLLSVAGQSGEG